MLLPIDAAAQRKGGGAGSRAVISTPSAPSVVCGDYFRGSRLILAFRLRTSIFVKEWRITQVSAGKIGAVEGQYSCSLKKKRTKRKIVAKIEKQ